MLASTTPLKEAPESALMKPCASIALHFTPATCNSRIYLKSISRAYHRMKELNKILAADFNKLAATLRKTSEIHSLIGKTYDILDVNPLTETHETLAEAFLRLRSSCITMRKTILSDFIQFFRYQKFELNSVEDLLNDWSSRQSEMAKLERKLKDKKELLFAQKEVAKWELKPDCTTPVDTLLNNKEVAFREMLPRETQEAHSQKVAYGYYANKVLEEFLRLNRKDEDETKKQFSEVAKKSCNVFEDVNVMWADMVAYFTQVKDHIDTSDEKIVKAHEQLPPNAFEKKARLAAMKKRMGLCCLTFNSVHLSLLPTKSLPS
eukprot:TRINITY_DN10542_c0_g3_i3.p1 TRINITY_DN10542_c0_g3~~TRINITY_DN10542_c0_g3_i3.p1  ORF type:complete len:320 (+),score=96.48 TRINITY_DN10542_c0_g3_i3:99-1058(+)